MPISEREYMRRKPQDAGREKKAAVKVSLWARVKFRIWLLLHRKRAAPGGE